MKTLAITISFIAASATVPADATHLKQEFLVCDAHSSQYILDDAEGGYCSEIYEKLKKEVFNNDNDALLRWWHDEKHSKKSN